MHLARRAAHGSFEAQPRLSEWERFWRYVDVGLCWEWTGATDGRYGRGKFATAERVQVRAYRWIWEQLVGPIPPGFVIDHLCRNPSCVNPDHLEPVTQLVNVRRGRLARTS